MASPVALVKDGASARRPSLDLSQPPSLVPLKTPCPTEKWEHTSVIFRPFLPKATDTSVSSSQEVPSSLPRRQPHPPTSFLKRDDRKRGGSEAGRAETDTSAPQQHGGRPGVRMSSCPWSSPSPERENTVGGDRRLRRPWPVSSEPDAGRESRGWVRPWAGQLGFRSRFQVADRPGRKSLFCGRGPSPVLSLPPPFVGRAHSPPPSARVPALLRCLPRGRDRGPAEPRALSRPPSAARGRRASAAAARARGRPGSRARACRLRGLRGHAACSGKVGRLASFGTGSFSPLCPDLAGALAGPCGPERARPNVLSAFPSRIP